RQLLLGLKMLHRLIQDGLERQRVRQALLVASEVERAVDRDAVGAVLDGEAADRHGGRVVRKGNELGHGRSNVPKSCCSRFAAWRCREPRLRGPWRPASALGSTIAVSFMRAGSAGKGS